MKAKTLTPVFTEYIPADLEPTTLYISMAFDTAVHLCACGCGTKIVTPIGARDWTLTYDGTVSLRPSVGNGQQRCRSHYYIRANQVDWLAPISRDATRTAALRDRAAHTQPAPAPGRSMRTPWWRRLWSVPPEDSAQHQEQPMSMTPVISNNVRAVGYGYGTRVLRVQFRSGGTYDYYAVTAQGI